MRLTKIGNSKGVILSKQILEAAGISDGTEIDIRAEDGNIIITSAAAGKRRPINRDIHSWEKQFKKAIKDGWEPESELLKDAPLNGNKPTKIHEAI